LELLDLSCTAHAFAVLVYSLLLLLLQLVVLFIAQDYPPHKFAVPLQAGGPHWTA
jgi:hypothetical protein